MPWREKETIKSLRKALVADSIVREKQMAKLLKMVREEERQKTIDDLEGIRDRAERSRD